MQLKTTIKFDEGNRLMWKALTVRLSAGLATIVFGAYAAMTSQGDSSPGTAWEAKPLSVAEAQPIDAGIEGSSEPSPFGASADTALSDAVQLVQHQEPASSQEATPNDSSAVALPMPTFDLERSSATQDLAEATTNPAEPQSIGSQSNAPQPLGMPAEFAAPNSFAAPQALSIPDGMATTN
ncbi:MAG: hypothetical protein AAF664_25390, partial [Planctomycetota bacterium]